MRLSLPAVLTGVVLAAAACGGAPAERAAAPAPPPASAPTLAGEPSTPATDPAPLEPSEDPAVAELRRQAQAQARRQRQRAREERRQEAREERRRERRRAERRAAAASNPLAGRPWGVYTGPQEMVWDPYVRSSGETRELLAEIALRPKAKWMGDWIADDEIYARTLDYIEVSQAGDPDTLVQMSMFRMVPWEHDACRRLPSAAEQASYRRWTDEFARAIGSTHAAVILQPDGPFALCVPGGSRLPSELIAYSARVLGALPHTSVYLDGGAGDWPSANGQGGAPAAADFLVAGGVEHVRGIALNSTHYSSTEDEVRRGAEIVAELAARGLPGKKVVINTSNNGKPFEFGTYTGSDPDDAYPCRSETDTRTCVALGIPPTTDVAAERWGLPDDVRALAREHVDAYLWFGRPWLYRQNQPFIMDRALAIVRSSPYL